MNRTLCISIALLGCSIVAPASLAEVVQIPVGQQSAELAQVKRPATGMTKERVETEFGAPLTRTEARGTPPISSWEYTDFVVYFENDQVIHSVLKHRPYVD